MKANRILLLMLFLTMIVCSCKTVKQSEQTKTDAKTELNANVKTEAESKQAVETKMVATDKGITTNNTNTKTTITDFSAPDSNGKQHATRKTVIEQTENNKKISDAKTEAESKQTGETNIKSVDKSTGKTTLKQAITVQKSTKMATPGWVYVVGSILSLGIMVLIWFVLKRFKIVK